MGVEPTTVEASSAEALVGQTLGRSYRVTKLLDEGGMGLIYVAEHLRLGREVAIKLLVRHAHDQQALQRFYREAALISRLQHPHIVSVLDFDTSEEGEPYLVMELLQGETLEQRLRIGEGTPVLSLDDVATIVTEIASALTFAHQADIIHRDLKPANVFLSRVDGHGEVAKLLDFGIGKQLDRGPGQRKLTGEFDLLGTPDYMAPEQALGENDRVDQRADQYALAAIAFEMVTGRPPFVSDNLASLLASIVHDEVPSASLTASRAVPTALDRVFARALARSPEDRYATVGDFAAALSEIIETAAVISSRPTDPAPAPDVSVPDVETSSLPPPSVPVRTSHVRRRNTLPAGRADELVESDDGGQKALVALAEKAKKALDAGDVEAARDLAESALDMIEDSADPSLGAVLSLVDDLFVQIFEVALGGPAGRLELTRPPSSQDQLSPSQAYLLSRIDGGISVGDLLSLSPADHLETLRALIRLVGTGIVQPIVHGEQSER